MHIITVQSEILKINVTILSILAIILKTTQTQYIIHYPRERIDDIECHKRVVEGDFPSADGNERPPLKSIFFIETSCKGGVNSRQACSIESAARAHPKWQINVLFAGPVSLHAQRGSTIKELQKFENIKFSRIHVTKYGKGTPLEDILASDLLNSSRWSVMHSADVLRYLTLYKWGGIYLDLDVIVVKPLDELGRNWVGKQSNEYIASGLVSIWKNKVGKNFADALIRYIKERIDVSAFDSLGPKTIMEVLRRICKVPHIYPLYSGTCSGISVYEPKYFYPVAYQSWRLYFENEEPNLTECYAHQLWNYLSRNERISRYSMYARLAEKFCPTIFNLYNSIGRFGF